jgi:hypothetical protein
MTGFHLARAADSFGERGRVVVLCIALTNVLRHAVDR